LPSSSTAPPAAGSRPATTLSSVDLPVPFGPVTISAPPAASTKEISRNTISPPRSAVRSRALSRIALPFAAAAKSRANSLELFYEILYSQGDRASGRHARQLRRTQRAPPSR